jgi:peptidoglycan hydrolase CwlO-like protein
MEAKKAIRESQKKLNEQTETLKSLLTEIDDTISDIEKDSDEFSDEIENSM